MANPPIVFDHQRLEIILHPGELYESLSILPCRFLNAPAYHLRRRRHISPR